MLIQSSSKSHFNLALRVLGLGCFYLAFPIALIAQSGWTKAEKEGFYQVSYSTLVSSDYYTLDGRSLETNQFSQKSLTFYGEYGVTDKFTVIANWPLQTWNSFETTETVNGIGDLRIEFKHALLKKYLPLSIAVAPELPIGKANNFAQSKSIDFEQINLPSGDGEFNVWTTLATSFALPNIPLYGNLFAAYNYRTHYEGVSFSDQLGFGTEIGYHFFNFVWINARLNTLKSVQEVPVATDFVRGDGSQFTSYSFGASIPIYKKIHLSVNYRNYSDWIVARENIYSSGVLGIGLYYEHKPKKK